VSRAYPLGCSSQLRSYYDYDSTSFPPPHLPPSLVRTADEFGLTRRLGAGKFSDVFEAVDSAEERRLSSSASASDGGSEGKGEGSCQPGGDLGDESGDGIDPRSLVVIKCLKPVSERKVRRELLVLTHASSLPNLARLRGVVVPEQRGDEDPTRIRGGGGGAGAGAGAGAGSFVDALRGGGGVVAAKAKAKAARAAATMPSIVLEHAGRQSRWLCHGRGTDGKGRVGESGAAPGGEAEANDDDDEDLPLSEYEIKYYLFHLLVALDALHSRGIMHRDVKPRNVLINRAATRPGGAGSAGGEAVLAGEASSLMLVDLGLADFYLPGQRYNVRVASRHYKAPELLVGNELYDYAVDLWGVGCVLAGLLFRREPFFRGRDNVDQLGKIAAVLGERDLRAYCDRVGCELGPDLEAAVARHSGASAGPGGTRRPWSDFLTGTGTGTGAADGEDPCPEPSGTALDLLDRLLVYDHTERLTAREAMAHPFFDEVRARGKAEIRSRQRDGLGQGRGVPPGGAAAAALARGWGWPQGQPPYGPQGQPDRP